MSSRGDGGVAGTLYEALAAGNFEGAAGCVSDGVLALNVATGDAYRGRDGFLELARGWSVAFPDRRFEMLTVSSGGTRIVAEYRMEGTHTGPLVTPRGHLPATGREVQVRFCDVLEIDDGAVSHIRSYFDSVTLLRQLGLLNGSPIHAPERRAPLELYAQPVDIGAPQRHKAIVHKFLQTVLNRRDPSAVADTCDRNFAWHGGTLGEARGLSAYQNALAGLFIAFPDLEVQVLDTIAEGDRVVIRFTMSGTHLGEFKGIPPTQKRVVGDGTNTYRLENSRIVEEWWQGDVLSLLQQMDAAPATLRPL
jgi:predicted ester cyclase